MLTTARDLGDYLDRNDPAKILGDRFSRTLCNNTMLRRATDRRGGVSLVLHGTAVATFHPDGSITLNTGGWETTTTKDRINSALWGTRYRVASVKGVWHIEDTRAHRLYVFEDFTTVHPNGRVTSRHGRDVSWS